MDAIDIGMWVVGFGLLGWGVIRVLVRVFEVKNCTARVEGRVSSMHVEVDHGTGDDTSTVTRHVKYEYWAEGRHFENGVRVSWLQYRRLENSQVLTIFYEPSNAKRHYVVQIKHRWFITTLIIVGGILFLVAAI